MLKNNIITEGYEACKKNINESIYMPGSESDELWAHGWRECFYEHFYSTTDDEIICEGDDFYLKFGWIEFPVVTEAAMFRGKKVSLRKPFRTPGGPKKFSVYVNSGKKNAQGHNIAKKVSFGDPGMKIKKANPKNRKAFASRHNCSKKTDPKTAGYWSCRNPLVKGKGMW